MNEIVNNKVNLCDSCSQVYPDCTSKPENVYFGDGIGHDNICACSEYRPKTCGDGDTISRQDTVDVIASMIAYHKTLDDAYWYVKDDAPSAQPQLDTCPIYGGMCGYPSNLCYECPRHEGAKEQPQWWTEGLQPFAQPQWIPVSERLPEYGTEVVTINKDDEYEINHVIDEEDGEWFFDGAVAWMPLPEPYAERREDA